MARLASELPLLLLLVPLLLRGATLLAAPIGGDVHYLTCNVTITPRGRTGESYEVKIQLDRKDTTASTCMKKLKASLEDMARESKKPLLETEPGHHRTSYLFSLQCLREANGSIHGNLTFGSVEKIYLRLYMKEKQWRVVDPVGRELMEKLSQDKHLNMTYEKILSEYCNALPELVKCEKMETKEFFPPNISSAPSSRSSDEPGLGVLPRNSTDVSISAPSNTTSSPSLPTQHSPRIGIPTSDIIVIVIVSVIIILALLYCLCKRARAIAQWVGNFPSKCPLGFYSAIPLREPSKLPRVFHPHGKAWQATQDVFDMPQTVTTSLTMEMVPTGAN